MTGRSRRWFRRVQVRTALIATAAVAITLVAGAAALVVAQRAQLVGGLTQLADQQVQQLASQVGDDGPDGVDLTQVSSSLGDRALMQVVDGAGQVRASSAAIAGEPPLWDVHPRPGQRVVEQIGRLAFDEAEPYVVVASAAPASDGAMTVIAAQSLETVSRTTDATVALLLAGIPLVLVITGGVTYWMAGRALAPVESIRRRVSEVSARDLDEHVPVPASDDEIQRLAETMNLMLDRLARSAASQRQFVADASHELRSPLTTIRATAEVARAHPETLGWYTASGVILAEGARLERLVDDLLELARSDERGGERTVEDVDLDDVVAEEASRLRVVTDLRVELDIRSVRVTGDHAHLVRAVRNLADNAATHASSAVLMRLRAEGGSAVLEVSDDGVGIPAAQRERVFDRFFRIDESRARGTGGTGLGLPIARGIARSAGGDVTVVEPLDWEGRGPLGARLRLVLPASPPPADDPVAHPASTASR
ncbi:ATP-binding protein [Cellulomonas sp. P5_C6]